MTLVDGSLGTSVTNDGEDYANISNRTPELIPARSSNAAYFICIEILQLSIRRCCVLCTYTYIVQSYTRTCTYVS